MGKHSARPAPKKRAGARKGKWPLILLLIVVLLGAALVATALLVPEEWLETESAPAAPEATALPTAEPIKTEEEPAAVSHGVGLPYSLDSGSLSVVSLFPSTVSNPDAGDAMGNDVASLEVKNLSGRHLALAEIRILLQSGETLRFLIRDLPAGASVWAFDTENKTLAGDAVCTEITCTAEYEPQTPLSSDVLDITAEGTMVTVTNLTAEDIPDADISFRCLFDAALYYGGRTWTYATGPIPAGGSVTLDVYECYLGTAEAVRVSLNG